VSTFRQKGGSRGGVTVGQFLSRPRWYSPGFPYSCRVVCPPLVDSWLRPCSSKWRSFSSEWDLFSRLTRRLTTCLRSVKIGEHQKIWKFSAATKAYINLASFVEGNLWKHMHCAVLFVYCRLRSQFTCKNSSYECAYDWTTSVIHKTSSNSSADLG